MAGHSKWANIRHRKGRQDAKRGKIFTRLIREIIIAAKLGGSDPTSNPRLRAAVYNALSNNMTRDTIDRAIKRGAGEGDVEVLDEIRYEGYGPGGVAVMVDCMTNNRNRTVGEVRHAFTKCGGNLGTDGSVQYLFHHRGIISFPVGCHEEKILEVVLEAGALDVMTNQDGSVDVLTEPDDFSKVKDAIDSAKLEFVHAEVTQVPTTVVELDKEHAESMMKLVDLLEDLEDVQKVYSNAQISDDLVADL